MPVEETKPGQDAQTGQDAQKSSTTTQSTDASKTQGGVERVEDLPQWAQEKMRAYREEAKTHREAKEAKEREASAAEQKRLADAGQFEQLAKLKAEEAAKPYQTRVADLEKVIAETNAQLIQQIPEAIRALVVPDLPADKLNAWLIKSLPALTRKPAPDTDAGAGQGGGTKPIVVTPQAEAAAAIAKEYGYNINPEAVAARAKQIDEQRRRPAKKDED